MERLSVNERKEVRDVYSYLQFPDPVLEPIWYGKRPTTRIDGSKAIVDQNTETVFGICSDLYQVIHYEDIVRMVEKTVTELPEFGKITVTPKMIKDGAKMSIIAKFEDVQYEIRKGDAVNPQITIRTSYDLGWKLSGMFGAFRLVCSNGMTVGKIFSRFAKRHITSLDPQILTDSIKAGMVSYSEQTDLWKKWAKKKIDAITYDAIWEALPFSPGEKEKIEKLPEVSTQKALADLKWREQATLWDFHSVVTQFATHEIKSEVRQAEIEPLIARAFDMGYAKMN